MDFKADASEANGELEGFINELRDATLGVSSTERSLGLWRLEGTANLGQARGEQGPRRELQRGVKHALAWLADSKCGAVISDLIRPAMGPRT